MTCDITRHTARRAAPTQDPGDVTRIQPRGR